MVALEKHIGNVESKITVLFNSINNIMGYSAESGQTIINISTDIKELKENLIYKEDLVAQLSVLHEEIGKISNIINKNNIEIFNTLVQLNDKVELLSQELNGIKNPESSKNKGIFRK